LQFWGCSCFFRQPSHFSECPVAIAKQEDFVSSSFGSNGAQQDSSSGRYFAAVVESGESDHERSKLQPGLGESDSFLVLSGFGFPFLKNNKFKTGRMF
jgi:hypothetical protein